MIIMMVMVVMMIMVMVLMCDSCVADLVIRMPNTTMLVTAAIVILMFMPGIVDAIIFARVTISWFLGGWGVGGEV